MIKVGGAVLVAADLSDATGLKIDTIMARAAKGMPLTEVTDPAPKLYDISRHSGDPKAAANRLEKSRARTSCRNGHPWPELQKINSAGFVECIQCGRDKALRSKRRKLARDAG